MIELETMLMQFCLEKRGRPREAEIRCVVYAIILTDRLDILREWLTDPDGPVTVLHALCFCADPLRRSAFGKSSGQAAQGFVCDI